MAGKTFTRGAWLETVYKAIREGTLSINELELLVMVEGLSLAARECIAKTNGVRTVIRGDNTAAISALNRWRSNGPAMRAGLRAGYETCRKNEVRVWGIHVAGEENIHADGLSRCREYGIKLTKLGYKEVDEPEEMDEWIKSMVANAKHIISTQDESSVSDDEDTVDEIWKI